MVIWMCSLALVRWLKQIAQYSPTWALAQSQQIFNKGVLTTCTFDPKPSRRTGQCWWEPRTRTSEYLKFNILFDHQNFKAASRESRYRQVIAPQATSLQRDPGHVAQMKRRSEPRPLGLDRRYEASSWEYTGGERYIPHSLCSQCLASIPSQRWLIRWTNNASMTWTDLEQH